MSTRKDNERIIEITKMVKGAFPYKKIMKDKKISREGILKYRLNIKMGSNIHNSIKNNRGSQHWETLVGYTLKDLIKHLTKTMPEIYTWQDYLGGKLHIDHIIPIRAFIFAKPEDEEFKQCWSLYNLRLLPAKENIVKGEKITNPILLGMLINGDKYENSITS